MSLSRRIFFLSASTGQLPLRFGESVRVRGEVSGEWSGETSDMVHLSPMVSFAFFAVYLREKHPYHSW